MSGDDWDSAELDRARALAAQLSDQGAGAPIFAARAPGRINLIGEHTDYSGLPVLPAAIDRSTIIVAARRAASEIEVANVDRAYPARRFALERRIAPSEAGDWINYVKAAVQGVIDRFAAGTAVIEGFRGASMIVDGRVPPAAGLSSSAALTVATALVFMRLNEIEMPPLETAQMVVRSEWYVGTRAGGMDQAASILGQRDHALFIEFDPLRARPVRMPADAALVVADSCEVADKSGRVRAEYNRRVIECALAARILGRALKLGEVKILGDVVNQLGDWNPDDLLSKLAACLPKSHAPRLADAARILDVDPRQLNVELLGDGADRINIDETRPFEILRRARHVLREATRVELAAAALEAGKLAEVGGLMNQSHESLKDDFDVSTVRLDAMVQCSRRGGALGARLVGAGFGGSILALCHRADAARVIAELDKSYYVSIGKMSAIELRGVLRTAPGASVIEL